MEREITSPLAADPHLEENGRDRDDVCKVRVNKGGRSLSEGILIPSPFPSDAEQLLAPGPASPPLVVVTRAPR